MIDENLNRVRRLRDEAFRQALRAAPKFNGLSTLEPVALELRRIWVRFYPHMKFVFNAEGHYPI